MEAERPWLCLRMAGRGAIRYGLNLPAAVVVTGSS